ncbi:MAG: TetR-like C-terminal domain-containing protein [Acidimicrobiales bacterium]
MEDGAPPSTRARSLSPDAVVAEALEIADEEGVAAVTLAKVARRLGCHVTSLYTHVNSIDDLHRRMAIVSQSALAQQLWEAALGRSGVDGLHAVAQVYRSFAKAHPLRARLLFVAPIESDPEFEEAGRRLAEPIRATLRGFGLDENRVRHSHRAFSAAMRGFMLAEAHGSYASGEADETFERLVDLFVVATATGEWPKP